MDKKVFMIWTKWEGDSYICWDVYPASNVALENVKKVVRRLEACNAKVLVSYDELTEERGRKQKDIIYETNKTFTFKIKTV